MLGLDSSFRFELYLSSTDMRKSFDSLCGIVEAELFDRTIRWIGLYFCKQASQ